MMNFIIDKIEDRRPYRSLILAKGLFKTDE